MRASTGERASRAHDVGSPPDYILLQISQARSLRPADEDACERVRGRRRSKNRETSMTIQSSRQEMSAGPARSLRAGSSLVRRLAQARDDPGKQRIRAWLRKLDDEQLSSLGLTREDIAVLRH
ncbi:MAG: hypothetical protein QOD29_1348 [Alphaproteobacteria bacterium]|nr:hypothetical protein [Alphaproteobacteria bacterium]